MRKGRGGKHADTLYQRYPQQVNLGDATGNSNEILRVVTRCVFYFLFECRFCFNPNFYPNSPKVTTTVWSYD